MAKMFYTLQEAAEQLGIAEDRVKELGSSGKLQVFRDRDQMMFKRSEIDEYSDEPAVAGLSDTSIPLDGSGTEAVVVQPDTGDATDPGLSADALTSSGTGSGIDVFEADEIETADPMAQTQVTSPTEEDDLVLESVGSGSGLLDLTHEGDDTSLGGAELLDEINIGDSGADSKVGSVPGSSGAFDSALDMDGIAAPLEGAIGVGEVPGALPMAYVDPVDPGWSGLSAGMLLGASACLIVALIVAIYAVAGVGSAVTATMSKNIGMYGGIMVGVCAVFGVVGLFIGKARG